MKRFLFVAVLFFVLSTMYGYQLGRIESSLLIRANPTTAAFLPDVRWGVSFWDQVVFWSGPILALLIIFPAIKFVGDIYLRDRLEKSPLEFQMMIQLKEWARDLARRDQPKSDPQDKTNPA